MGAITKLSNVLWELVRYLGYPRGWDGYDGDPFRPSVILRAMEMATLSHTRLRGLTEPVEIIPGPSGDGSVDIEIEIGDRALLYTFYPDEQEVSVYRRGSTEDVLTKGVLNAATLERHFTWIRSSEQTCKTSTK